MFHLHGVRSNAVIKALVLKVLTVVISISALAQTKPVETQKAGAEALKGFQRHLINKQASEFRKSLQQGAPVGQIKGSQGQNMQVFKGGWNGSGGGGGLACFKDEAEMRTWINPDGRAKNEWLGAIQNFQMLDLYDMEVAAEWPKGDFNIEEFLRERIRKRLENDFPVLSESLLANFELALKAPWYPSPSLKMIDDTGPLVSGKAVPKNCIYGQWAQRLQNTEVNTPVYVLMYNKSLDDRLRQILNEREYRIQRAVLVLHEAVYGAAYHAGLKDSGYTRSVMNLLLMPDVVFEREVVSSANNGLLGYFWIGETLPVLTSTSGELADFQQTQKTWSDQTAYQWNQYISFLKKMQFAMKSAGDFMDKNNMPPYGIYKAIRFGTPEYHFFRSVSFVVFASDWSALTGQSAERITDLEGFYLLASELATQQRIESVQRLALSDPSEPLWKLACEQVKAQQMIWKSLPLPKTEEDRMIRGVSEWIAYKAMNYCVKQKLAEAAK